MSEAAIQSAIMQYLRTALAVPSHFGVTDMGGSTKQERYRRGRAGAAFGWPDVSGVVDGRGFYFEVKALGKYPNRRQREALEALRNAGAVAEVVRSVEDVAVVLLREGVELRALPAGMRRAS